MNSESLRKNSTFVLGLLALVAVGITFSAPQLSVLVKTLSTGIALLSLNMLLGYAGQVSLGHAAFIGTGAFVAVNLGGRGLPILLTIPLTGLIVAGITALIGMPSLRIKGLAVAVATLVYGIAAQKYLFEQGWFTGANDFLGLPTLFDHNEWVALFIIAVAWLGILLLLDRQLLQSKLGRAFFTVREAEERAVAFGVAPGITKLRAYALSGFFAGVAGAIVAYQSPVSGGNFTVVDSLVFLSFAVVGGAGSRSGVLLAAALLVGLPGLVPPPDARLAPLLGGIVLVLVILFLPTGLGGLASRLRGLPRRVILSLATVAIGIPVVISNASARAEELESWNGGWVPLAIVLLVLLAAALWFAPEPPAEDGAVEGALATGQEAIERARKAAANADVVRAVPRALDMRMPTRVMFEASNVGVRFGGVQALKDISLEIREGEIVGLIGANGAGKSTFYNVVSGFVTPTPGSSLKYRGKELLDLHPAKRTEWGIARTFQHMGLVRPETVRDNVLLAQHWLAKYDDFGGVMRLGDTTRTEKELRHRAELALEIFGLEQHLDRQLGSLPYGTMRMCELASAVAGGSDILFFDEASAGLAPDEAHGLADRFLALREELGLTLVIIEHHVPLIARVCDYVYCLASGRQLAEGEPASVQSNPEVIAEFLGRSTIGADGAPAPSRARAGDEVEVS